MIRQAKVEDAAAIIGLTKQLVNETSFMLHEPGEQDLSIQQQEAILADFTGSKSKAFLLLELDQKIVGFCVGIGSSARRNQHNLYCVMGIIQTYTGQGLGRELLISLEAWAKEHNFTRLELTVMAHNKQARSLYQSQGFEEEGVKRQSLKIDGEYVDEIYMSKLLV